MASPFLRGQVPNHAEPASERADFMFSPSTIQELKEVFRQDYGRDITNEEATEIAVDLIGCIELLTKIHYPDVYAGNKNNRAVQD